ncbi:hypothetical protein [Paenibacillus abyssi]|uniref:Methyltransferase n=1 Tax=Paenibacillus abyssi TaxID=1340531 RepID=A0A917CLN4_9BACL|nr:hypothetical protein [Paenibacillus abyssi]GGF89798.1 hypothetical protein GCM10010916_03890 [Paenibacillus abyssi]
MSRSWERKVRKNTSTVNKARKKSGTGSFVPEASRLDRFKGRNLILPVALVMFIGFYVYMNTLTEQGESGGLYWLTIVCYVLLAALFFFRRPYLTVGKEFVQTRKMTGDKILRASGIQRITVQRGYVVIEQKKGANWVFSRAMNRFPTEQMAERLKIFANDNQIEFTEK